MIRRPLEKYQAEVVEIHPLSSWKSCRKCNNEFKQEIGWKVSYDLDKEFNLCTTCSPTYESVIKYCHRIGVIVKV